MGNRGPVQGTNDVELVIHTTEDDETVEYVEETDSVRYIGGYRRLKGKEPKDTADREPLFETSPFHRWSETNCVETAAKAAAKYVNEQLDTDEASWAVSSGFTDERRIDAVVWVSAAVYNRDERLVHQTALDFDEVVAAAPTTVTATYDLDGNKRELVVPIYVRFDVFSQE
ncbi:hypothetical protein [Haladaptatus sp. YSMS36]|uniref:hypothetical protein n=1 Tax=Haladaptatus sp. YSMS36 TaxID=3033384 RepID=UPI0023E805BB|nr:hypothetical protein [Haladaptatus sp. YSMS36]